jgi:hypothetical protein
MLFPSEEKIGAVFVPPSFIALFDEVPVALELGPKNRVSALAGSGKFVDALATVTDVFPVSS